MAAQEQVGARALSKARRGLMPKVARIEGRALEVQNAIVLGNQVQAPSRSRNANELANHAVRVGNGMKHMAANGEIEAAVRNSKFVNTLMLERQARREIC